VDLGAVGLDSPVQAQGSVALLEGLLNNLIDNALRYGRPPDGALPRVTVELRREAHEVELSVSDNGPGMALTHREVLLRRWAQGEAGVKLGEGAGLGLAIVARYAALLGGRLELGTAAEGSGLRASLAVAEANVKSAMAMVQTAEAQLHQAQADSQRQQSLVSSGMATQQFAEQSRTAVATAGATRASKTLGTITDGLILSSPTTSAIACAAARAISSVNVRAWPSSMPRNTPGKASTLLIWFGWSDRPVATTAACLRASRGSTSGSGLASAKTTASWFIPAMSSPVSRFGALTPMNTSAPRSAPGRSPA